MARGVAFILVERSLVLSWDMRASAFENAIAKTMASGGSQMRAHALRDGKCSRRYAGNASRTKVRSQNFILDFEPCAFAAKRQNPPRFELVAAARYAGVRRAKSPLEISLIRLTGQKKYRASNCTWVSLR
jgi:hypothetical protein